MSSIFDYTLSERIKLAKITKHIDDIQNASPEEMIHLADMAINESPNEWIFYVFLSDYLQKAGRYAEALLSCQKAVELNPNNIKPAYALATTYNLLTRAAIPAERAQKYQTYLASIQMGGELFDVEIALAELGKVGIDVDTAALLKQ